MKWTKQWIHYYGSRNPVNSYNYYRKTFSLPSGVKRAHAHVTADSRYQLYVNGHFIGRGPARCDPRHQSYDTYDIAPYLIKGRNAFGALVHHYGVGTGAYIIGREGVFLQAAIKLESGNSLSVGTDASWTSSRAYCWKTNSRRINGHQGFCENYDARRETCGWSLPDFIEDDKWQPVVAIGVPPHYPWMEMRARDIPIERLEYVRAEHLVEMGSLDILNERYDLQACQNSINGILGELDRAPVRRLADLPTDRPAYFLYDMGKEISAYYHLSVDAPEGVVINISSSERSADGRMPADKSKSGWPLQTDRYTTKSGRQTWSSSFNWRGFRYLQVVVYPYSSKIRRLEVGGLRTTADLRPEGDFECSDKFLTHLWRMGLNTMECCMHDGIVDNPWREQQNYVSDEINLFTYYAFGDDRLPRNMLRQIAQSQNHCGELMSAYPWSADQVITEFCAIWITALKEYYLFTGDLRFVKAMMPVLQGVLRWYRGYLNKNGLLENVPRFTFIDWIYPPIEGNGHNFTCLQGINAGLNMFYLRGLLDATWLAKHTGAIRYQALWARQAEHIKHAIHRVFWDQTRGLYVDSVSNGMPSRSVSQHVNALAILLNIAPPERWASIVSQAWESDQPIHRPSPAFYYYIFRALAKCRRHDLILKALREEWQGMAGIGNQTCWETFQSDQNTHKFAESYCQSFCCPQLYELPAEVLGVKPLKPAFRLFEIYPVPADIGWARGRVPTPNGSIQVAWKQNTADLQVEFSVPEGCVARMRAPEGWVAPGCKPIVLYRAGRHRIVYKKLKRLKNAIF